MREQCMNVDKQYMNSDPCEITVEAQREKKKKKKGKHGKENAVLISIQTLTECENLRICVYD